MKHTIPTTTDDPQRVMVRGDLFHPAVPDRAVYVGRAAPGLPTSPYANPHKVNKPCPVIGCGRVPHTRGAALVAYRRWLRLRPELVEQARAELAGADLACWCGPAEKCHADLLLRFVAGEQP